MRARSATATTRPTRCALVPSSYARAWTPCVLEPLALCCAPRLAPFAVAAERTRLLILPLRTVRRSDLRSTSALLVGPASHPPWAVVPDAALERLPLQQQARLAAAAIAIWPRSPRRDLGFAATRPVRSRGRPTQHS